MRYFFAPLIGCFILAWRAMAAAAFYAAGFVTWLAIGFAWCLAMVWKRRERVSSLMIAGVLGGLFGYAAMVWLMQFGFVAADYVARAAPNVTECARVLRVR